MTKIIDNVKEKTSSVLSNEISHVSEVAIASAYFNLSGYNIIRESLNNKPLRLLLGRQPSESVKFEEEVIKRLESFDADKMEGYTKEEYEDLTDIRMRATSELAGEAVENEDDENYFNQLTEALRYFSKSDVEIRRVKGRFFHGKAYMGANPSFSDVSNGFAAVGSSNFTGGGLSGNRELNMLTTDREGLNELIRWFNNLWNDNNSVNFKDEFLNLLRNYIVTHSPYEVLAKALYEVYRPQLDETKTNNLMKTLFPHQILSTIQASRILKTYNGVVIADSTGLGKTRVAINLAIMAINEGKNPLLIAPKSALDTTWADEMNETHVHLDPLSSEDLSQNPDKIEYYQDKDFIIVDEAHYFKSSSSNRYSALQELMATGEKQIVLLTATPINNRLMDLYSLLSLYLKDNSITDLSPSLKGYFSAQQKLWENDNAVNLDPILRRFVVRTSRELAKALSEDSAQPLNFPERKLGDDPMDRYETGVDYEKIDEAFDRLTFIYYDYAVDKLGKNLRLPDGSMIDSSVAHDKKESLKNLVKMVMRVNFFKRLESSVQAFKTTMRTLYKYIESSSQYAETNSYFVPPKMKGSLTEANGDDEDFSFPTPGDLYIGKYAGIRQRCELDEEEVSKYVNDCKKDLDVIEEIMSMIPDEDNKLERVINRLQRINLSENNGVIIFTQYYATANYIYQNLRSELSGNIFLTTGKESKDASGVGSEKTQIIKKFKREGGFIVSTDVLSESQNLQNAQYVLNYDFPWNPVVLIQRAGRVDRLKSKHSEIFLINILPVNGDEDDPKSLAHFLSVMKKLYKRIDLIRDTIGLESTTLGEDTPPRDFGIQEAIARNDPRILDVLKEKIEQFSKDPMETLAEIMQKKGEGWLKDLPMGIGSYKHSERDGLFILFKNGNDFHWVLKYFDGDKEMVQNPNEIITTLLDGDVDNKGETIEYKSLMKHFKDLKSWLRDDLTERLMVENVQQGRKSRATKQERDISEALQSLGDEGIELSAVFNSARSKQTVVTTLYRALKDGNLLEKAREVLSSYDSMTQDSNNQEFSSPDIELRRVCWCLLKKEM